MDLALILIINGIVANVFIVIWYSIKFFNWYKEKISKMSWRIKVFLLLAIVFPALCIASFISALIQFNSGANLIEESLREPIKDMIIGAILFLLSLLYTLYAIYSLPTMFKSIRKLEQEEHKLEEVKMQYKKLELFIPIIEELKEELNTIKEEVKNISSHPPDSQNPEEPE